MVLLGIAAVAMLLNDVVLALVAFVIFPLVFVINLGQRRLSPLAMRAQRHRAEVSEVAHESFDGASSSRRWVPRTRLSGSRRRP